MCGDGGGCGLTDQRFECSDGVFLVSGWEGMERTRVVRKSGQFVSL